LANNESDSEEAEEENFDPNTINQENQEGDGFEKRQRVGDEIDDQRKLKRLRKEIARDYYAANSTGRSISGVLYQLATDLNKANLLFFWLSVLGLTDQFLHSRISQSRYN